MTNDLTPYQQALLEAERAAAHAEELRKKELAAVVQDIRNKIRLYGISAQELGFTLNTDGARTNMVKAAGSGEKKDLRTQVRPKYQGKNGESWAGRGKTPAWVAEHIATGGLLDDLLIEKKESV